jgi:hypothetical protein
VRRGSKIARINRKTINNERFGYNAEELAKSIDELDKQEVRILCLELGISLSRKFNKFEDYKNAVLAGMNKRFTEELNENEEYSRLRAISLEQFFEQLKECVVWYEEEE